MFKPLSAFSGLSVIDQDQAKEFYVGTLGLKLNDETMGLTFDLPGGGSLFVYPKGEAHQPATYTVLNFAVADIDEAVADLTARGVTFERYTEGPIQTDERGIARGRAQNMGPDIAWFKDPSGNILAVLQE